VRSRRLSPVPLGAAAALVLAVLAVACSASAEDVDPLVESLREGGHVLFIRHASTDSGMDATDDPDDCAKQRNLTDAGRVEAEAIGEAIRRFGIPVVEVRASPWCRTMETAQLAFGDVEPDDRLRASADMDEARALAADPPEDGNLVLVGHYSMAGQLFGTQLDDGEAAVIAPGGELVATVTAEGWEDLAR
jgi:phosphohistidine phosphatase SixA